MKGIVHSYSTFRSQLKCHFHIQAFCDHQYLHKLLYPIILSHDNSFLIHSHVYLLHALCLSLSPLAFNSVGTEMIIRLAFQGILSTYHSLGHGKC